MPRLAPTQSRLKGNEIREFRDALVSAYGSPGRLEQMLLFNLNKQLARITLAANLDQLVFDVIKQAEDEAWSLELLSGARAANPSNPELLAFAQPFGLAPQIYEQTAGAAAHDQPMDPFQLEKLINASNGLKDVVRWRERLGELEAQVCRIEVPTGAGAETGTGFLLGTSVVLTNYHVIELVARKLIEPARVILRFDFKQLRDGVTVNAGTEYHLANDWLIDASPPSQLDLVGGQPSPDELDYALLRVADRPGADPVGGQAVRDPNATARGWIQPPTLPPDMKPNSALFILQHPQGKPLQLALDTNAVITPVFGGTRIRYRTNTEAGSSGAPCFDDQWNLVAIHQLGDPGFHPENRPQFNQGILIKPILEQINRRGKGGDIGR